MSKSSYILTTLYRCCSVSSLHSFLYMTKVKEELNDLEQQNIISEVEESTPWVFLPLNCYSKENGAARLCVVMRIAKLYIL